LAEPSLHLIVDPRYETVCEAGIIVSQTILVAVAVDGEGQRQALAVELAHRESRSSWRDFLSSLKQRGLTACRVCRLGQSRGSQGCNPRGAARSSLAARVVNFLRNALD
jgi:hypothetical protein